MRANQDDSSGISGNKKRVYYLAFTKDHDRNLAINTFVEKFGRQPAEVFIENRVLWLGPALEK